MTKAENISVIICAYTQRRWGDLVAAIASVQRQTLPATEIIVVIDHNPQLLKQVQEHFVDVTVVENTDARGLRGARNSGIAAAQGGIIAFLDDDAIASDNWLMLLIDRFKDPQVLGAGGAVIPMWVDHRPGWMPEEFYWVVGCSYRGMSQKNEAIRNPIGANMVFRREIFDTIGDFHSEALRIGRQHAGGCEETELCIRARQYWPQRYFLYVPQARVLHRVPAGRTRWRYFCSRCYAEGLSKAVVTCYVGLKDSLSSESSYAFHTLPRGIAKNFKVGVYQRDISTLVRAGAIIAGFTITVTGYCAGLLFLGITGLRKGRTARKAHSKQLSLPDQTLLPFEIKG